MNYHKPETGFNEFITNQRPDLMILSYVAKTPTAGSKLTRRFKVKKVRKDLNQ